MKKIALIFLIVTVAAITGFISSVYLSKGMIWTEGDSYMRGAWGYSLTKMIAQETGRQTKNTAVGGSDMPSVLARMQDYDNFSLRPRIVIIWDGSPNGFRDVKSYVNDIERAIDVIFFNHFIILPPMYAGGGG